MQRLRDERFANVLFATGIVLSMVLTFGPDMTPDVEVVQQKAPSWTLVESHAGSSAVPVPTPIPAKVGGGIKVGLPTPEAWRGIALPADGVPRLDVCFCLDTTGSMRDEIELAKTKILDIAKAVAAGSPAPEVEYALVIYRDRGDEYVVRVYDFMDAGALANVLAGVRAKAGGDTPESVSEALHRSVNELSWDERSCRAIYLIGDARPHTDYDNGYDYAQAARDALERGIVINAIGCSGISKQEKEFREVTEITGGVFVYLQASDARSGTPRSLRMTKSVEGSTDIPIVIDSGEYYEFGGGDLDDASTVTSPGPIDGCDSGDADADDDETRSLDDVLTGLIQQQAMHVGVTYEDPPGT